MKLVDDILIVTKCGKDAMSMNTEVQSKINNKGKANVGNYKASYPKLMIHSEEMLTSIAVRNI